MSLIGSYLDKYECKLYLVLSSLLIGVIVHILILFDNFELPGFVLKLVCSNLFWQVLNLPGFYILKDTEEAC